MPTVRSEPTMKAATWAIVVAAACLVAHAAETPPCTAESVWDQARESLARHEHAPEFLAVTLVDGGKLLAAMNEWFAARASGDAARLEELTIPLPDLYDSVNRSWIQTELKGYRYDIARPLLAQVDPSNPQHVLVLSEVTLRIAGKCTMSAMGCDWVKLNGAWKTFPGGPRIVQ